MLLLQDKGEENAFSPSFVLYVIILVLLYCIILGKSNRTSF